MKNDKAIQHFIYASDIFSEVGMAMHSGNALGTIAEIYQEEEKYDMAIEYFLLSSKQFENSFNLEQIGNIYKQMGNYDKAIEYYDQCLIIDQQNGNEENIGHDYANLGVAYKNKNDLENAQRFYKQGLDIFKKTGNEMEIAKSFGNLANLYSEMKDYKKAKEHHLLTLEVFRKLENDENVSKALMNIADVQIKLGNCTDAITYGKQAVELSEKIKIKNNLKDAYKTLAESYACAGETGSAYKYFRLYSETKDSLISEESTKRVAEMQTLFETEKKEKEIQILNKDKEIQATENRKQKIIIYSAAFGIALLLALAFFIFRGYKQKQKANFLLEQKNIAISQQKEEIEKQKSVIEVAHKIVKEKQKEITDSITYALRIQKAILPHRSTILSAFPESFVLYKPKDIVAGDFYWFNKNHETILIAAADCTGHGVPGGFTSMICSEKLNDAVKYSCNPGEILSFVNKGVKVSLRQAESNESTKDGMDIALCSVNLKSRTVNYTGANRPFWIIRNGKTEIEEIKATKKAIGGFTEDNQVFETHTIQMQQKDTFYIFSDGYADQNGGDEDKKLMTKKFKQILIDIQSKSMKEQKDYLDEYITKWMGTNTEQRDDILVIGVRI